VNTISVLLTSGVRHARDYVDLLREVRDVRLIGIAEEPGAPAWAMDDSVSLARDCGLDVVDMRSGLAQADAAVICSEPARHASLARRAIRAGCHVLIDKPAAVTSQEFDALAREATAAASQVVTSVHRLLSPAIVRARRIVDDGAVGLPLSVDLEWIASGGLVGSTVERPELVCDPALSGGGELTNFGWYPILALHHLTGLEVKDVAGFAGPLFGGPHARFGVEDTAVLSIGLEHGVTSTVTVSRVAAGVGSEPVSSTGVVLGSHGHLVLDESRPDCALGSIDDPAVSRRRLGGSAGAAALRACFADFFDAIRTGGPVALPLADIGKAMRVLDAAREAVATGRRVRLADDGNP
jgi:predicted dehydrogenase